MHINPPYGFTEIVPLSKTHRVLLPKGLIVPMPFRTMNPMPVSYSEFPVASHDYPLVFVSADQGETFTAMMVLGLEPRQNLYVTPEHTWDISSYAPAYFRRYPFCMTRMIVGGEKSTKRLAGVEKGAISNKGERLFDDGGEPLPDWARRQKLLFEYESDLVRTEEMCKLLVEHDLLEQFTVRISQTSSQSVQLTGLYRVSEMKLHALPPTVFRQLVQRGVLGRIYAHLLSLDNFNRLEARRERLH